ncbi:benzoate carboxyl methyltransferase [Artemisia annua]|uniref:Benzoate carboxyl methyltransferase n=1 Tax=Artemisia annua TaxID=35608 RepID=A0A2U1KD35_ARTAN|nr:benzoate carboxyl methyltransferase [Artemisia annua]
MSIETVLHMNTGNGESSYATNSYLQEHGIQRALHVTNEAINRMCNDLGGFPGVFKIADLGCSSGPNALLGISNIISRVHDMCNENNFEVPQFQVFLNDLFENDFNIIFRSLPTFYAKLKNGEGDHCGPCFVSAVPGSFYSRLFPNKSIHLFLSSYAVHWLSRVPQGIENNKCNIYMAKTSPTNVFEAYRKQFEKDFTKFLRLRSQEIIRGGRIVFTIPGRSISDPTSEDCCIIWELLAKSLVDMVKEGRIPESDIDSFNIPYYTPYEDEVRDVIKKEGSFLIDNLYSFALDWEPYNSDNGKMDVADRPIRGKNTAKLIRAVIEPMMATHFGNSIMDMVFYKFEEHVVHHLSAREGRNFNLVISLTKH